MRRASIIINSDRKYAEYGIYGRHTDTNEYFTYLDFYVGWKFDLEIFLYLIIIPFFDSCSLLGLQIYLING